MDDDVWVADTADDHDDLGKRHVRRLEEEMANGGFREGIGEGKELRMQTGFDEGFRAACRAGLELGFVRGLLSAQEPPHERTLRTFMDVRVLEWIDGVQVAHMANNAKEPPIPLTEQAFVRKAEEHADATLARVPPEVTTGLDISQVRFWRPTS